MNTSEMRRQSSWLGVAPEVINDVLALTIILFGIFLLLSLATNGQSSNLMGVLGSQAANLLTFVFGKYVAYIPVVLTLLWGLSFWRGRRWRHVPARVAGGFFAIVCLCALLAVPYANADFRHEEGFRVGGALGNFLVHRECLALRDLLGLGGCYLVFTTLLLVSLIIAGNIQLRQVLRDSWEYITGLLPRSLRPLASSDADTDDDEDTPAMATKSSALFREERRTKQILEVDDEPEALERVETVRAEKESIFSGLARLGRAWARPPEETSVMDDGATSPSMAALDTSSEAPACDRSTTNLSQAKRASAQENPVPAIAVAEEQPGDLLSPVMQSVDSSTTLPAVSKRYQPPTIEIFRASDSVRDEGASREHRELAETLLQSLSHFGIGGEVDRIECGPTIVRIEITPPPGVKLSRITCLEADLARALQVENLRIVAPVPGRKTVGFEIPNKRPRLVRLREVIESKTFLEHESPLAVALGVTITGEPYIGDLATMPHLLIAGATGSGKSVCLNSLICSILFRQPPSDVKFIMIDPKRVELNMYHDIPHLLAPVVTDVKSAAAALKWAVEEMEARYKKLAPLRVRNIAAYNSIARGESGSRPGGNHALEPMPYIVIVIDELADLILTARNEIEDPIVLLAQKSRAVGMHLVVATQRPSVNVITGIIKANFPCRVAFKVAQKVDSRTILDSNGAENLLGRGDMLFAPGGGQKPIRLQGCYASDQEVEALAEYLRQQQPPQYWKETFVEEGPEEGIAAESFDAEYSNDTERDTRSSDLLGTRVADTARYDEESDPIDDQLLWQAVSIVLTHNSGSTSLLQRKLKIGFARAGRLMDLMEKYKIVGPSLGPKPRDILVIPSEYLKRMEGGRCPWLEDAEGENEHSGSDY
jgi:S-DNA-T family DNA segregation ATPase FtsK/SpoIIIE